MHPLLIEGTRMLTPVIIEAVKTMPAAQLARFGLMKGSVSAVAPLLGGVIGGGLAVALAIPSSRKWMLDGSMKILSELKRTAGKGYENVREGVLSTADSVVEATTDASPQTP